VQFIKETTSAFYYHTACTYKGHFFTIDLVVDENLFRVGEFHLTENKILIASLPTLLRMKSAALVSRASEKDLSDLLQLFSIFKNVTIPEFIELGQSIDGGVNAESMLAAISGAILREDACDFSLNS